MISILNLIKNYSEHVTVDVIIDRSCSADSTHTEIFR